MALGKACERTGVLTLLLLTVALFTPLAVRPASTLAKICSDKFNLASSEGIRPHNIHLQRKHVRIRLSSVVEMSSSAISASASLPFLLHALFSTGTGRCPRQERCFWRRHSGSAFCQQMPSSWHLRTLRRRVRDPSLVKASFRSPPAQKDLKPARRGGCFP